MPSGTSSDPALPLSWEISWEVAGHTRLLHRCSLLHLDVTWGLSKQSQVQSLSQQKGLTRGGWSKGLKMG